MNGQKFGRLTVLEKYGSSKDKHVTWLCICDCGNKYIAIGSRMRNGYVSSCGCLSKELSSKRQKTHGMRNSSEYTVWQAMKRRCLNPDDKDYPRYGGRGITICKEWIESFETFFKEIGPRPQGTTIDRKDNRKGYKPGNIRWATASEQQRNRSDTFIWYIKGVRFDTSYEAASYFDVSDITIGRWVNGFFDKRRSSFTPPRKDCRREQRYVN